MQVYRNKDGFIFLKLVDFGLVMEVKELIFIVCGTLIYVVLEIFLEIGKYCNVYLRYIVNFFIYV